MPWPEGDAIQFLADQGIKVLVNLTTEPASYQQVAESLGIRCVTEDIPDFCPRLWNRQDYIISAMLLVYVMQLMHYIELHH